ncbi:Photosynthetic ndh subunit of subcomplex b 4 protein [Thalictrum thalictroides]|uniref:Photosynthetic ndh subunit of subcomplex b 4 protein n=1 Tax=Thalictrum thalictroides TaxID=46969 RepID=A0A7J6WWP4_THATH|nr:Photosynthetic ndh subunit of subcomplex b 4 protein [Thalictrum thalictroides]
MAEAIMGFASPKLHMHNPSLRTMKLDTSQSSASSIKLPLSSTWYSGRYQGEVLRSRRANVGKVKALPDLHLLTVLVQHMEGQRDIILHKSVWHLSDEAMKKVYTFYIMFTCWGCCFFGAMKDPYYDSEAYRKDGGDGTGHWVYEKQEDIEEKARAALWREELIEEIELKVGGLRELEEAGKKEELVK